jgi:hypothetical protein
MVEIFLSLFLAIMIGMWRYFSIYFSNIGSDVVYIEDEEAFHQACFQGMRRGIQ